MASDWTGYLRRLLWRIANPRSNAGLFLRLAVAISIAIWLIGVIAAP